MRKISAVIIVASLALLPPLQGAHAQVALWKWLVGVVAAGWSTDAIAKALRGKEPQDSHPMRSRQEAIDLCVDTLSEASDRYSEAELRGICAKPSALTAFRSK